MRKAYYNWRNDNRWRRLREMKDDLSQGSFKWRFHNSLDEAWIAVGDKKLIEINDNISKWGVSEHYNPIFNSYNAALKWLKGEEEMPTFNHELPPLSEYVTTNSSDMGLTFSIDVENCCIDFLNRKHLEIPPIKRIEQNVKNGTIYTTVLWEDNSDATVVKCAEDDTDDLYFAVASAIAIKLYGSNSAFKRMIDEKADILEEPAKMEFSINMNTFAENIRKAFKYKENYND